MTIPYVTGPNLAMPSRGVAGAAGANGIFSNVRLAKSGAYSLANGDKGKTLDLSGAGTYTVTVGAASGFDSDFAAIIYNAGAGLKTVDINGVDDEVLDQYEALTLLNLNNVWVVLRHFRFGFLLETAITTVAANAFTFDPRTKYAEVELVGAGGAGAGTVIASTGNYPQTGSGGGSGAVVKKWIKPIPAARTATITVPGVCAGTTGHGADGGTCTYTDGTTTFSASGGSGGSEEELTAGKPSGANQNGRPGHATGGYGAGNPGDWCLAIYNQLAIGGIGASSPYGYPLEARRIKLDNAPDSRDGFDAVGYGAGGNGGCCWGTGGSQGPASGGDGAQGIAFVREYR